ncbi:MAG: GyrI-like domain-containing protein [Candidatus Aminicenantales bacterium]
MKRITCLTLLILSFAFLTGLYFFVSPLPAQQQVMVKEVAPFVYCCLHHKGPFTDIQNIIGKMWQAMQSQGIFPMGAMIGVYYNSPGEVKASELEWEIGFPISVQNRVLAPLEKKRWEYKSVASSLHIGPYEETGRTIDKILKWMEEHNFSPTGPILERYLDQNPSKVRPEELRTEIWIPCKITK